MKGYIKNRIKKMMIKILEELEAPLCSSNNPYNIHFGSNSKIEKPLKVVNGQRIYIGDNSSVGRNAWLGIYAKPSLIENTYIRIENDVYIGNYSCITAVSGIKIGQGTLISEHFYASDHVHGYDPSIDVVPAKQKLESKGEIRIGNRCFIGFRVSILPGVTLGNYCVVGANSTVTHSFSDYSMLAGSPAKVIKRYSLEDKKWINV